MSWFKVTRFNWRCVIILFIQESINLDELSNSKQLMDWQYLHNFMYRICTTDSSSYIIKVINRNTWYSNWLNTKGVYTHRKKAREKKCLFCWYYIYLKDISEKLQTFSEISPSVATFQTVIDRWLSKRLFLCIIISAWNMDANAQIFCKEWVEIELYVPTVLLFMWNIQACYILCNTSRIWCMSAE